jgi:hypothetical protein
MKRQLSQSFSWVPVLVFYSFCQLCALPLLRYACDEAVRVLSPATPTPDVLVLEVEGNDEPALPEAYYAWLRTHRDAPVVSDPDLDEKAHYLAGEAPRLRSSGHWAQWDGLRYAAGPASGEWGVYWPGCNLCPSGASCYTLSSAPRKSMATASYPGLQQAPQMGAAVAERGGQLYLAVVWPGTCPTPQPLPTPRYLNPGGPGR